jgi:hypothetical protein
MIDKKMFKKAVGSPLEQAGFLKKGQSWYLNGTDSIIVLNLQKSNWSELYYVNFGIWLKAFGDAQLPQFNHCHLYYRVESLFPEEREFLITSCDLQMSSPEMLSHLSRFVEQQLIPFAWECTEESKLREFMSRGLLKGGLVRHEAKMFLTGN